ncbi:MAG: hypothetical protein MI922_29530, partial [Bacteroidales bacterium]|nr:hypothetical protein [Bacteroidales bacterium]
KENPLGKITEIRGLCYRNRTGIGKQAKPLQSPASLDYNLWLGPAQDQTLYRPRFHYDWHWYWYTGNGDFGNQGPHEINQMSWTLGDTALPKRITSFGGRFGWQDAGETPNIQFVSYEFEDAPPVYFEVINMHSFPDQDVMPTFRKMRTGVLVQFEGGTFKGGRGGGWIYDNDGKRIKQFKGDGGGNHQANFIEALRTRKESVLRSPIATNHTSDTWMHLGNISQQIGTVTPPNEMRERLRNDQAAQEALARFEKQLANWKVDYQAEPWKVGATLTFDAQTETCTGPWSEQANKLLHRQDRAPFVVPKEV